MRRGTEVGDALREALIHDGEAPVELRFRVNCPSLAFLFSFDPFGFLAKFNFLGVLGYCQLAVNLLPIDDMMIVSAEQLALAQGIAIADER